MQITEKTNKWAGIAAVETYLWYPAVYPESQVPHSTLDILLVLSDLLSDSDEITQIHST